MLKPPPTKNPRKFSFLLLRETSQFIAFQSEFVSGFSNSRYTMTSITTTWSPSSFQLRLAFNGRKTPSFVLVRTRRHKLDRRFTICAVAGNSSVNNNGIERRRSGNSWVVNSNSSTDGFAGWNADEQSGDSSSKQSLKGEGLSFLDLEVKSNNF